MNVRRAKRLIRTALSELPEATSKRGVIQSAGWWITEQPRHDGPDLAVSYKNPRPTGERTQGDSLIASCTRALTATLGTEFKIEQHGTGLVCPSGLLGTHTHVMDK